MRWESTQRHMGALYERISENYRASYGGEVEVGADTRAFRRFRATRDGTIHEDRYTQSIVEGQQSRPICTSTAEHSFYSGNLQRAAHLAIHDPSCRRRDPGKSTPYQRCLTGRMATGRKALLTDATPVSVPAEADGSNDNVAPLNMGQPDIAPVDMSPESDERQGPRGRELSFTEWGNMSDAAIVLAPHEEETAEDGVPFGVETLPDAIDTDTSGAQLQGTEEPVRTPLNYHDQPSPESSERQLSPPPGTQAPSAEEIIDEGQVPTPIHFVEAVVIVEPPTGKAVVGTEAAIEVRTPVESNRESSQEVAIRDSLERTVGLEGGEAVPTQAIQASQGMKLICNVDDPIVLDDDDDDDYDDDSNSSRITARQRCQNEYSGMVQWSSPEFEDEVITSFEEKWMEIQTYWIYMDDMRSQVDSTQIRAMLDQFNEGLEEVYDDGSLAPGSASLLLEERALLSTYETIWQSLEGV
ncbi:uncharacterized protein BDR25DRAFT_348705 [Lindgomyces ingoldianus]|uniref:Uncharacterized protein n=1 Tax=Lindgomyces ingoldianus TaxID=673940 RepID=A0ACB6RI15_9PLEO|nr:uncharacterized protein BDR25DRAFT_348705 [Lindgomyces ingoldianus]KAF2478418.1 hypothetical protein BDR25DRAFT_348705 [Lindgomyces ingoldianus]